MIGKTSQSQGLRQDPAPASAPAGIARAAITGIAATAVTDAEIAAPELAAWSSKVLYIPTGEIETCYKGIGLHKGVGIDKYQQPQILVAGRT